MRKLEPFVPEDVKEWRASLSWLDREATSFLHRHILTTAQRVLGEDFEEKILLPPPPIGKTNGAMSLGTVVYGNIRRPFGISKGELLQGLGIYGRSGAGKTNICFKLLEELGRQNTCFLFLDVKRTLRHFLPSISQAVNIYTPGRSLSPLLFNPMVVPPGIERRAYISQLIDVLGSAYTLGDGARNLLRQVFQAASEQDSHPTLNTVLKILEKREVHGRASGWKESALRALQGLTFVAFKDQPVTEPSELVRKILEESTIIELDGLDDKAQKFLVNVLMLWLFQYCLQGRSREALKLVVFVEEAHNFLYKQVSGRESVMSRMLRQGREVGLGFVVVDQHPHLLSSAALGNTFTSIFLNTKEPSDLNKVAVMANLREGEKSWLNSLDLGYGIVKLQGKWHQPFLVCFDEVKIDKGIVTDKVLASHMKDGGSCSGKSWRVELSRIGATTGVFDSLFNFDGHRLLVDCEVYPCDGVRERFRRLKVGMKRGAKLKTWLLENEFVKEGWVTIGKTKRLILRPIKKGLEFLGLGDMSLRESTDHYFWKHWYAIGFRDAGYDVEFEVARMGGRVDVLAKRDRETIGVEVETGKSDFVNNVLNGVRSGFKVVVVATTENAREKIERRLTQEDLLIEGWVQVVLRGAYWV